jgi:transaldolase
VSIEVSPELAHDTAGTIAQAKELWKVVDRPNALIKIPATKAGLPAITEAIASGISVNVTLIFSLERYAAVIDAYLTGIEQAKAAGHDISTIHSVASFFVSRVDTEVDKRLDAIGRVRRERFTEGLVAQVLHVGPYRDEGPTVERLHAFVAAARRVGARTLAEGVETDAHRRVAIDAGIDYAQGYLFGPPASYAG